MTEGRAPTILLLGAGGQLGAELREPLGTAGRVVALARAELDLADVARTREVVRAIAPAAVVNAAAFTSVDRAEAEPGLAFAVNATAPRVLAEACARLGALFVHYSTDYVFDGTALTPYTEDDAPNPLGAYAESKLAGERAIADVGGAHLVLRVSWVYGSHGRNFVRWLLRAARRQHELSVVHDQTGVPTWSARIADGTARILAEHRHGERIALDSSAWGLYHFVSLGAVSRIGFVEAALASDPRREEHALQRLVPIPSSAFPSPARRPLYSVLDSARLEARFGVRIGAWRADLDAAMARGITPLPPEQAG